MVVCVLRCVLCFVWVFVVFGGIIKGAVLPLHPITSPPHNYPTAGHDAPFVNNYGVWVDEFAALGLQDTLDRVWDDAACWFGEGKEVRVGRPYGRVCRRRLRSALLERYVVFVCTGVCVCV